VLDRTAGKYKYRNEKKKNTKQTSVEHLLYIGLFLVTVDVISKYSLPIQHEVILKKIADVLPVHLTINVENTLFSYENNVSAFAVLLTYRYLQTVCNLWYTNM
jgi:hypothetical protein